jgi:hypothetical protein
MWPGCNVVVFTFLIDPLVQAVSRRSRQRNRILQLVAGLGEYKSSRVMVGLWAIFYISGIVARQHLNQQILKALSDRSH